MAFSGSSRLSFDDLVRPIGEDAFLERYQDKQTFVLEQDDRSRFEHLLSWPVIKNLLGQQLLTRERFRVIRDGRDVAQSFYRRDDSRKSLDSGRLRALIAQGASLVFNHVQELLPEIGWLAQECELHLSGKLNVNAYVTFGRGGAFRAHFDSHDVLVLQVHGRKRWQILDRPEPFPLKEARATQVASDRPVVWETDLLAGNVIFVPRGVYHRAEVSGDASVHLTFGIHTVKGLDFVDWLRDKLAGDPMFRRDVPVLASQDARNIYQRDIKRRLAEMVDDASIDAFITETNRARRPLDAFDLADSAIGDGTRLRALIRRRDYVLPEGAAEGARALLDRLVDGPADMQSLAAAMAPDIDAEAAQSAARDLLDRGLIEILSN